MCLRDLGETERAIKLSTAAVDDYEPWRVRARCFAQADLASAHLLGNDLEQAAAVDRERIALCRRGQLHPHPQPAASSGTCHCAQSGSNGGDSIVRQAATGNPKLCTTCRARLRAAAIAPASSVVL